MKHSLKVTIILLIFFLLSQFVGLGIVYNYIDPEKSAEAGKTTFKELPLGERPPLEEKTSFISIIIAILVGTGILLLLLRYNLTWIWKLWFLIAVVMSLTVALGAFIGKELALLLALALGIWKIFKPNFWVHNFTELVLYGGLAAIFVPVLNLFSAVILLILISVYDAYAVWKSKHMITLAKSQAEAKVFAGLLVPYELKKAKDLIGNKKVKTTAGTVGEKVKMAIIGGGDLGFPLIFAGVLLKEFGLWQSLLIPFFAAVGLGVLLFNGKEDRFYPAMPFISAGCFVGLGIVLLINLFI